MKHVIYHTEYYNRNEMFCHREEECDAYFNIIDGDDADETEAQPPIGCRLLQPKLLASKLSKKQWDNLVAKKPDHTLRYASLYDVDENQYVIYAIYECVTEEVYDGEGYTAHVSLGENNDIILEMFVIPKDFGLAPGDHVTLWHELDYSNMDRRETDNWIRISSSKNPKKDRKVWISRNGWNILGKWESMEHVSLYEFVYHCRNSLFRFDVTINIEKYSDIYGANDENFLNP